jgi:hypothetical protein
MAFVPGLRSLRGGLNPVPQMTPNLLQVHWHAGHPLMPAAAGAFQPAAAEREKRFLAMYSGIMRLYPLRFRLHKDCLLSEHCLFVNWTSDGESLPKVAVQHCLRCPAASAAAAPASPGPCCRPWHGPWQPPPV